MKKKQFLAFNGTVSEMASSHDAFDVNVPITNGVDVAELTKDDKDPLFVTIEVLNEGVSANKRKYTEAVIKSIEKQINELKPEAYEGHLKDTDRATKRPKPVTLWLGAVSKVVDGKLRLFAKGYVLPYAKDLKQYLRAAKATSKKVATSVYGQANQVWDALEKAYQVSNFHLESIDWARNGSEGVATNGFMKLAAEMNEGETLMDRADIVKDLSLSEVEELNPTLVSEMRDKLSTEVRGEVEKESGSQMATVREMLEVGADADVSQVISEMRGKIASLEQEVTGNYVDKALQERVKSDGARKLIKKIVIAEMKGAHDKETAEKVVGEVLRTDEAKAIVREMTVVHTVVTPTSDNRQKGTGRKYTTL